MGRGIEVRFWDGEKMVDQHSLYWTGERFVSGVWVNEETHIEDSDQQEVEVMQYTGLLDSNGVQICEGDILKRPVDCNNELHGDHAFFEVKMQGCTPLLSYLKSEEGWILPRGYLGCCLSDLYDGKMFAFAKDPSKLRPTEDIEVIGNIHCNPELLEVKS